MLSSLSTAPAVAACSSSTNSQVIVRHHHELTARAQRGRAHIAGSARLLINASSPSRSLLIGIAPHEFTPPTHSGLIGLIPIRAVYHISAPAFVTLLQFFATTVTVVSCALPCLRASLPCSKQCMSLHASHDLALPLTTLPGTALQLRPLRVPILLVLPGRELSTEVDLEAFVSLM